LLEEKEKRKRKKDCLVKGGIEMILCGVEGGFVYSLDYHLL
jgi:hypothetical protein